MEIPTNLEDYKMMTLFARNYLWQQASLKDHRESALRNLAMADLYLHDAITLTLNQKAPSTMTNQELIASTPGEPVKEAEEA